MKFTVCPSCYVDIPGRATSCPRCGYGADSNKKIVRKKDTLVAIGLFSAVVFAMVLGILLVDQVVSGNFSLSSSCGENEACLVTGLVVCDTVRATPKSFGIETVEVEGKVNGHCMVHVDMKELDGFESGERVQKTCVFTDEELPSLSTKDLYLCQDFDEKDQAYEQNLISSAFIPPEPEDPFS